MSVGYDTDGGAGGGQVGRANEREIESGALATF